MEKKSLIFVSLFVLVFAIQTGAVQVNIAPKGIPSADSSIPPLERLNDGLHPPLPYVLGPPWVSPINEAAKYNFYTDWGYVPRWIAYDFGTDYKVERVVLLPYIAAQSPHYYPINYEIQISDDGSNWETMVSVTSNNYPLIDHSFPSVSTRFIRIYVTLAYPWGGVGSKFRLGATEFEVYVTIGQAAIDIDPDTLNLNSKGKWITCYIELPEGYDVHDIDTTTVALKKDGFEVGGEYGEFQTSKLMVKFPRSEVQNILEPGEVELTVTGELTDGTKFEGSHTIRVIDKGGKP